jgi:hypothetical protein
MKMKYVIKLILGILLYLGTILNGYAQQMQVEEAYFEVYIMPRQPYYGWASNPWAFFHFDKKRSVLVPYEHRSFYTTTLNDSVHELYYKQIKFPINSFANLEKIKDTINPLISARARIVLFDPIGDTIIVESEKFIYKSGMCYKMSDEIWNILFAHMPPELAENWLIDFYTEGKDDTYLRKAKKN